MAAIALSEPGLRCRQHCEIYLVDAQQLQPCAHRVCALCVKRFEMLGELFCPECKKPIQRYESDSVHNELVRGALFAAGKRTAPHEDPPCPQAQMVLNGNASWRNSLLRLPYRSAVANSLVVKVCFVRPMGKDYLSMCVSVNPLYPQFAYEHFAEQGVEFRKKDVERLFESRPYLHVRTLPETRGAFRKLFEIVVEDNEFPANDLPRLRKLVDDWTGVSKPKSSLWDCFRPRDYQRVPTESE